MSRLNKLQIYAIRWLDSQGKQINDIANELSIPQTQISKTLEKYGKSQDESTISIKTTSEPVEANRKSKTQDLMIRHTSAKKTNNVSIMTREASALNDEVKKNNIHPRTEQNIFRPNK